MKIQQHTNGCLMGQRTNKERNKKIPVNKQKWKHSKLKPLGCTKVSVKSKIYINQCLCLKVRKIAINNLMMHFKLNPPKQYIYIYIYLESKNLKVGSLKR